MFPDSNDLFSKYYGEEGCRVFLFAIQFHVDDEEAKNLNPGSPPSNYKDPKKIQAWYDKETAKIAEDAALSVAVGHPLNCFVATEDGEVITRDPELAAKFLSDVLEAGCIVLGRDAPQRVRALATWAMLEHGTKFPLEMWRRPAAAYGARRMVTDPLDFILSSKATAGDRERFKDVFDIFTRVPEPLETQLESLTKFVAFFSGGLTTQYLKWQGTA